MRLAAPFIVAALALVSLAPVVLAMSVDDPPVDAADPPRRSDAGLDRAADLIQRERFEESLPVLAEVLQRNPQNADALNLLGYANRKLGRFDEALAYYRQALEIDPRHLGAREYLGEAYLELDDPARAVEQLRVLEAACILGCPELTALRSAIAEYQARRAASTR